MAGIDSRSLFTTIRSEGGLLSPDLLARIASGSLPGQSAEDYGLEKGARLSDAIAKAWEPARAAWTAWEATRNSDTGAGISEMREQWVLPLFRQLGYGRLDYRQAAESIGDRRFVISHRAGAWEMAPPVHTIAPEPATASDSSLMGAGREGRREGQTSRVAWLDRSNRADASGPRRSPHGLLQEYLNLTGHLWGIVTDGRTLRALRDNASLSRAAYVEIDLDAMFRDGNYADFVLLYQLLHRSRLPQEGQPVEECWLEQWRKEGEASGARARKALGDGVEKAIEALGQGFLEHPANDELRRRLQSGALSVQGYYRQLLRVVYRLLFLLAAEERDLLFAPGATSAQRQVYRDYYGVNRLRDIARRESTDQHDDLWQGALVLFRALRDEEKSDILGISALGGLFDTVETPDVDGPGEQPALHLANAHFLSALRGLGWITREGRFSRINYRDMNVEELGSVYEGLLEQQPHLQSTGERTTFSLGRSGERKSTGSYYTNQGLVRELIRSALEPAIAAAIERGRTPEEKRRELLDLKVCDPACGSGHFLLAAARRIGRAVAEVLANGDEPSPAAERAAVREAVGHCVYGVDLNPLAVDLCKVALWLEGQNAGKPLQFLDHHIRHGNALVGATEAAMAEGVPDAAFDAVTGDSKTYASTIKRRNRDERKHRGQQGLESLGLVVTDVTDADALRRYVTSLRRDEESISGERGKADLFVQHQASPAFQRRVVAADLWTGAFFWPLQTGEANPPTDTVWRRLSADPKLVDLAKGDRSNGDARTVQQARGLAHRHDFFHWELEFEEVFSRADPGFDVILGNPPWERIKLQEQEFFAQRDPWVASAPNAAERKRRIESLKTNDPDLYNSFEKAKAAAEGESKFLRGSGRFPLTGRGDINTYSVFAETNTAQLRQSGRAGMLVPTGIATDDTNKFFFSALVDNQRIVSLFDFENREGLFPSVDSRYKFSLLTTGQPRHADGAFDAAFFLTQPGQLEDTTRVFTLSAEEIALLNPNTRTAPIFRTARDAEITKKLYQAAPVLVREGRDGAPEESPWGVTFKTLFHMSNDSHLFRTREDLEAGGHTLGADGRFQGPLGSWDRLYEGKMIGLYNHRAADVVKSLTAVNRQNQPADLSTSDLRRVDRLAVPLYWVHEREVVSRVPASREWFVAFRDVSSPTNERTVIASVVPWAGAGHKLPLIVSPESGPLVAALTANLSSMVLDYVARQKMGGTSMGFYVLKQLPLLPPRAYSELLQEIICRRELELAFTAVDLKSFAEDLGHQGAPFAWDEARRPLLRAELDGIYAHLYQLARDDFAYILDQFPIVKRKDNAAFGEYRTSRLCLQAYHYYSWDAVENLRTAVTKAEIALTELVVSRLANDLSRVPEIVQAGQEAEREKQQKAPRALSLSDFLGAGYLSLLPKVIKPNRETHFADLFDSNRQVDDRFGGLIGLRNALAHSKAQFLPDKVRTNGEAELRWFSEKLGLRLEIVSPPSIEPPAN